MYTTFIKTKQIYNSYGIETNGIIFLGHGGNRVDLNENDILEKWANSFYIYLDGDTLVFSDLTEMINLEMNNNIILGFVDNSYKKAKQFGINTNKYITCGVILINLKKMRKENTIYISLLNIYKVPL
jgi:hypothetical protein